MAGDGIQHITPPAIVKPGGLPGYFYFYSFKDPASGQQGVHSHYFLFKGPTMISLQILGAVPVVNDNLDAIAGALPVVARTANAKATRR